MKTIINTTHQSGQLSQIEKEVIHMMAYDYDVSEMMQELSVGQAEIIKLQSGLYNKLEVEHESALIRVAYERGMLMLYECERKIGNSKEVRGGSRMRSVV